MLNSGSFGAVYLAEQVALERLAAVKVLHRSGVATESAFVRFLNEAKIAASLSHPNIVAIYDHAVEDGRPWIAYEYVAGGAVDGMIAELGRMRWTEAARLGFQVASALAAAHERGVLHRDVKPPNVLVAAPGRYKLTDFGIAHWDAADLALTGPGMVVGTPAYLAPEQVAGLGALPQSDQYALGTMLFEVTTGERVYAGARRENILDLHLKGRPRTPSALDPSIPKGFDDVVLRSLAKHPKDRFPSASAMATALAELLSSCSGFERPLALEAAPDRPRTEQATESLEVTPPAARHVTHPVTRPVTRSTVRAAATALCVTGLAVLAMVGPQVRPGCRPPPPPTELPTPAPTLVPRIPPGMRLVPGGAFRMGHATAKDAGPERVVHVDRFYIDRYEVTNREYDEFCAKTGHRPRHDFSKSEPDLGQPDVPVVGVTWQDAVDYCTWARKRLPTEAEWEKAARGTDGRKFPWGDPVARHASLVNLGFDGFSEDVLDPYVKSAPVTEFPAGDSPYGVRNMAGNVAEWCSDFWRPGYEPEELVNPKGPRAGNEHTVRGGHYRSDIESVCTWSRYPFNSGGVDSVIGFRGVYVPDEVPRVDRRVFNP